MFGTVILDGIFEVIILGYILNSSDDHTALGSVSHTLYVLGYGTKVCFEQK